MECYQLLLFCVAVLVAACPSVRAVVRHYFLAAVEVDWDYAPSGRNMVGYDTVHSQEKIERRRDRIGSVYRKAVYKRFADGSFTRELYQPPWMGMLGPTIRSEVGDVVYVHFRNMARAGNFSVHPHGMQYFKDSEGAQYIDGMFGRDTLDDAVPPGGSWTYTWRVSAEHAPLNDDDNCVAWGYHSHTRAPKDVDTGLVGIVLTCRKGVLAHDGRRKDVDREMVMYADIANENNNWYFQDNHRFCGDPRLCRHLQTTGDQRFRESNIMYHINGYTFGNLPDFPVCEGETVVWYFMSLNMGIHTVHVNGQTLVSQRQRVNTVSLFPASFYSGTMIPINPGRWLMYCRNQFHFDDGMQAFVAVRSCPKIPRFIQPEIPYRGVTRKYYIAIEEIIWDYAPGRRNGLVSETTFLEQGNNRIGKRYKKAVYREYLDDSFMFPKSRSQDYGISGPPIKAEVGDDVIVVVMNKASRPYSFLANGVSITKDNEGAFYKQSPYAQAPSGAIVTPGSIRAYRFSVPAAVAPTKLDTACLTNIYHSAVDLQKDIYSGLFGPLLVCKPGTLDINRKQKGVNREFFINWQVIDENLSWYIDQNIRMFTRYPASVNKEDPDFILSNQIRAINGRTFGTLEGLRMCVGDRVSWHMYGLGERFDHHHFGFDGNNFRHDGRAIDTASVFPGVGKTVTMIPDQVGRLNLRNQQLGYEFEGMYAYYDVMICPSNNIPRRLVQPRLVAKTFRRRYYIAAIEMDWEYCPVKVDAVTRQSLYNPEADGYQFVRNDSQFVGSAYYKSLYREFTDDSFLTLKPRTESEKHLGLLGPFIRGNIGDTIEILFKNMASYPYSIIPRNLIFKDGSSITEALPTLPGQSMLYRYRVPKRSGPGPNEPNCVGSLYTSRVHPANDTYSGMIGPLVICRAGVLDAMGRRTDIVTKEFAVAFAVIDENKSNYNNYNFKTRAPNRRDVFQGDFVSSNVYFSMNGFIYNNLPGLVMNEGEVAAWYIFGIGSESGVHTAHFHGQLYIRRTKVALKRDLLEIFPGTYETVEMLGHNVGTWLFHCHVSVHTRDGMKAVYSVVPRRRIYADDLQTMQFRKRSLVMPLPEVPVQYL